MKTYLPIIKAGEEITPRPDPQHRRRGVGLPTDHVDVADVATLGCDWFYDWGCTADLLGDPRYVPMSWAGGWYVGLPEDYSGYLLALNEPDNSGQLNISAGEAARRVILTQEKFPRARLIVGGVSYWGRAWLSSFVQELGDYRPAGWHVHGYAEWNLKAVILLGWFAVARSICPGGEFWVTEFADVGALGQAEQLLEGVREANWITRYAWFANRLSGMEWYFPAHWSNPALIGMDGQLTAYGRMYVAE